MNPTPLPARSRMHLAPDESLASSRTNARSFLETLDASKRRRLSMALTRPGGTPGGGPLALDVDSLPELSVFEHQELKALFDMLDDDGSGAIDEDELRRAFDMLGEKVRRRGRGVRTAKPTVGDSQPPVHAPLGPPQLPAPCLGYTLRGHEWACVCECVRGRWSP